MGAVAPGSMLGRASQMCGAAAAADCHELAACDLALRARTARAGVWELSTASSASVAVYLEGWKTISASGSGCVQHAASSKPAAMPASAPCPGGCAHSPEEVLAGRGATCSGENRAPVANWPQCCFHTAMLGLLIVYWHDLC